jgi:curved DNA-binding protein
MSVQYQDYYAILGVPRNANDEQIKAAYRKLARQYHPDVNKTKEAEDKFKQISEAHEVLKDPTKRQRYDALGSSWQNGQDFRPPPGAGYQYDFDPNIFGGSAGGNAFSNFFEAIFGADAAFGNRDFAGSRGVHHGNDLEAQIEITLREALIGGEKNISFDLVELDPYGREQRNKKNYKIKIPTGTVNGAVIRLAGQGASGHGGGQPGDLLLRVKISPDPKYSVNGKDLTMLLSVSPWEAALGGKIDFDHFGKKLSLNIPAGSQAGSRLRLRGHGLANKAGLGGDLYVQLQIVVPKNLSSAERDLFKQLAEVSRFNPRS